MHKQQFGVPKGTIKATVLIETIMAAFEMDEILYELRDHSAGLNCGRWDYIFSYIKRLTQSITCYFTGQRSSNDDVTIYESIFAIMYPNLSSRNAPAIGGMAAQIPIKGDEAANEAAFAKVREDKRREATDGHDGTWVAHPGLVPVAWEQFDEHMPTPNQIHRKREDVHVTAEDLLEVPQGDNYRRGISYKL